MALRVPYALAGFGGIAERRIAREGFGVGQPGSGQGEAVLVGATDLVQGRRQAAENLGLRWFPTAEAVLADPSMEAVFIATDNASHYALAMTSLAAAKHVIVEKPMATNLAHAQELVETAAARGLSLAVDHMMIHNAYNREARRSILAGEIGQVNDLTLHMEFLYGATPEEAATWRCAQPDQIGGPIGDVGSHCLYMAEFLTGSRIRSLQAVFLPEAQPMAVESGAFIRFRTESGLSGTVRVSFADARGNLESTLSNLGYEVFGTRGVLRSFGTLFQLSGLPGEPVRLRLEKEDGGRVETMRLDSPVNIYQSLIADHARSVLSGQRLTGEDGLHNLRCVLAAYASARAGGRDVRIP